jgi:hypothetical protein
MSFRVTGQINTSRLRLTRGFVESLAGEMRDTLDVVRKEGEDFLRSIVPVDQGFLVQSAHGGTNQVVVYWAVAIAPNPERDAPYAVYQNRGWTDRGGGFHEGHFFMERTEAFGAALLYRMTGDVLARVGFINAAQKVPGGLAGIEEALGPAPTMGKGVARQLAHIARVRSGTGIVASYDRVREAQGIAASRRALLGSTRATRDIISR